MAEEKTAPQEETNSSNHDVQHEAIAPAEATPAEATSPEEATPKAAEPEPPSPTASAAEPEQPAEPPAPAEPDAIQPYVDRVKENIHLAVEDPDIGGFLREHIKTFREEWDGWSESARYTYTHMMTAQLLQRKAAATQIAIGNQFKLPRRSAHAKLMASIKRAITKPAKRKPALSIPTKLRPTSSQK
jgi:hypothetical protein